MGDLQRGVYVRRRVPRRDAGLGAEARLLNPHPRGFSATSVFRRHFGMNTT